VGGAEPRALRRHRDVVFFGGASNENGRFSGRKRTKKKGKEKTDKVSLGREMNSQVTRKITRNGERGKKTP